MLFCRLILLGGFTLCVIAGCSGDGDDALSEPVAAEGDTSAYPDDPAMADDDPAAADSQAGSDEDPVGALTDEPFGAPSDVDSSTGTSAFGDDTGGANDDPVLDPTPLDDSLTDETTPSAPGAQPSVPSGNPTAPKSIPASPVPSDPLPPTGKVARYVKPMLLNVRERPSLRSPIVRRLLGGAKIFVAPARNGFMRIRAGQFVRTKMLSKNPTRKVSRSEVTRAWKRGRYKDTWKPPP